MDVDALDLPPCLARYDLYAFSTGYLDVPAFCQIPDGFVHVVVVSPRKTKRHSASTSWRMERVSAAQLTCVSLILTHMLGLFLVPPLCTGKPSLLHGSTV